MDNALAGVLQKYSGNHYQELFEPGNMLKMDPKKGVWIISRERVSRKNEEAFYTSLVSSLFQENLTQIPNAEALICRINAVFQGSIPVQDPPTEILFKSSAKVFAFLSNFFPTLIVYNGRLFRSSEHLYQWRIVTYLETQNGCQHYQAIREIADPLKVRNYSHEVQQRHNPVEDRVKEEIMRDVVPLKFKQNPHLCNALGAVQSCIFKEDTESPLWGRENNLMGRILTDFVQALFATVEGNPH